MVPASGQVEHLLVWDAADFHDVGELVDLVLAREDGVAGVELGHDAPETPHVNGHCVWDTEDYLWSTVESRLDVGVDSLAEEAGGAIINNLNPTLVDLFEHYILWLQITMHDPMVSLEFQSLQNLDREAAVDALGHALKIIILNKFIQIDAQALECYQKVLSEDHEVVYPNDVVLIVLVVDVQVLQRLELDSSLVLELLLVPYDLDGHQVLCLVIQAFDCLAETTLPKELEDFVSVAEVVFKDDLVVALLVVVAIVEYIHLFQSLFMPLNKLRRLPRCVTVSFDLS